MKRRGVRLGWGVVWFVWVWALWVGGRSAAQDDEIVLYETRFEAMEGFDVQYDLAGQNGWVGLWTGGNGILEGEIEGFRGQVAYVGFTPPAKTNDVLTLLRPVDLRPIGKDLPIIRFAVAMQIEDSSTNAPYFDDFRWSVYNADPKGPQRLLSLDFDNDSREIHYVLDDNKGFIPTGYAFANHEIYDLEIVMNFARNLWKATLNGAVLVNGAPITTRGSELSLGDIDAVWAIRTAGKPGDNFMMFDDYRITATPISSIPATLETVGLLPSGKFLIRVLGEPGLTYLVESTADFATWREAGRVLAQAPSGIASFEDSVATAGKVRFYRARAVVP